jgi:hypothetical protein
MLFFTKTDSLKRPIYLEVTVMLSFRGTTIELLNPLAIRVSSTYSVKVLKRVL